MLCPFLKPKSCGTQNTRLQSVTALNPPSLKKRVRPTVALCFLCERINLVVALPSFLKRVAP